jgi:cysteine desulfurase/selenocysteine lyase
MSFDAERLRMQFPILQTTARGKPLVYLDNGASSQMPQAVIDAVTAHETTSRANILRGIHYLAEAATTAYEDARVKVAQHLNVTDADEIVFTNGTTAGINLVAHAFGSTLAEGDEIVVSMLEHHSNIVPWQLLRDRTGIGLKVLPVGEDGRLDLSDLDGIVTDRCRLIAVTHASNVTGAVTDVKDLADAAQTVGAKLLLDGAQSVQHGPVDVPALGCDFYAFSGHKTYAPNGIGVLWARKDLLELIPPFLGGGEMIRSVSFEKTTFAKVPHKFEAGTPPIAQAVGLGAAIDWLADLDWNGAAAHEARLTGRLLDGLGTIKGTRLLGPSGLQGRLSIVSFDVAGVHPHDVCQVLDGHGVAVRGGHHCAQPLMDHFDLTGTTRASLTFYNTDSDIETLLTGLDDAVRRLA